jgi:hypothetical protein
MTRSCGWTRLQPTRARRATHVYGSGGSLRTVPPLAWSPVCLALEKGSDREASWGRAPLLQTGEREEYRSVWVTSTRMKRLLAQRANLFLLPMAEAKGPRKRKI